MSLFKVSASIVKTYSDWILVKASSPEEAEEKAINEFQASALGVSQRVNNTEVEELTTEEALGQLLEPMQTEYELVPHKDFLKERE